MINMINMNNTKDIYMSQKMHIYALRKEMEQKARDFFSEESKTLFDKYSDLTAFGWNQYTPYFNDGDHCTFSVNTDNININAVCGYEGQLKARQMGWDGKPNPGYDPTFAQMYNDVKDFLQSFASEDMVAMFGDHVSVEVTREGTDTASYTHE